MSGTAASPVADKVRLRDKLIYANASLRVMIAATVDHDLHATAEPRGALQIS